MSQHQICSRHQNSPTRAYCPTCARMTVEYKIVMMTAKSLLANGYAIAVNDGDEIVLDYTADLPAIEAALFTTDEDYFFSRKQGEPDGWIRFIYGNDGPDVINDYTLSLEPIMTKVDAYADKQPIHDG